MWLDIIKLILAPLIAGVVAVFLTNYWGAHFSLRRFREEQWWQEKRRAYDAIIRQLSAIKFNAGSELARLEVWEDQGKVKLKDDLAWDLKEIGAAGAYLVTEATIAAIEDVFRTQSRYWGQGDPHQYLEKEHEAAEKAIAVIRQEALRDLGIRPTPNKHPHR